MKISKIVGAPQNYNLTTFSWGSDLPFDEYYVTVAPTEASIFSSATPIPGTYSTNVHGAAGPYPEDTDITTTVDGRDLELASPGDGDKIIKVFARRGGTWSE
jgi:hypothetical protein